MKVLLANKYYFLKGGAERVFFETARLLERNGHEAIPFAMKDPRNIATPLDTHFVSSVATGAVTFGPEGLRTAGRMLWSFEAARKFGMLIKETKPDVLHAHNIYHQLSPSILAEARRLKLPAVMTLHDYHLISPNHAMYAGGHVIELSKSHPYLDTLRRRAVKGSFAASALDAFEGWLHRAMDAYGSVRTFIAPSRFLRDLCVQYGMDAERFEVIPHFIDIGNREPVYGSETKRVLYVGRLSEEKGAHTLIAAMEELRDVECVIAGDGPQMKHLQDMVARLGLDNIFFAGRLQGEALREAYESASVVAIPSATIEVFGLTALEAYAAGKPVVASDIGGLPEVVRAGVTGFLSKPGDPHDLANKLRRIVDDAHLAVQMGQAGRRLAETEYAPEKHLARLMNVYKKAIQG